MGDFKLTIRIGQREIVAVIVNEEDARVIARGLGINLELGEYLRLTSEEVGFKVERV